MNMSVPRVGLVQLGCPKNLVDSERILTQLRAEGYVIAPGYADADVVIVNTCGFLDSALRPKASPPLARRWRKMAG
jgi:ribosomal protein S12 methylthiotransferase